MGRRYIVCLNERQANKNPLTREAIIKDLLEKAGHVFEYSHIKQDLQSLQETRIEEKGHRLAIRSKAEGVCGKVFEAVGIAMPPTIREI